MDPNAPIKLVESGERSECGRLTEALHQAGRSLIQLDVSSIATAKELFEELAATFMFPEVTYSPDAAEEFLVDLSWFDSENGYVIQVMGVDELRSMSTEAFDDLFDFLFPTACRHWQWTTGPGDWFAVVVCASPETLEASESKLDRWMVKERRIGEDRGLGSIYERR